MLRGNLARMRITAPGLGREVVIRAYLNYDSAKKRKSVPDTLAWPWTDADALDTELRRFGFKTGVLAGYQEWCAVELDVADLRQCAVVSSISASGPRDLGSLEAAGKLVGWRPSTNAAWFAPLEEGRTFDQDEPFILRPATKGEAGARWYLEDGSGRATALVANAHLFAPSQTVAYGFLGSAADPNSSFMRERFSELLQAS